MIIGSTITIGSVVQLKSGGPFMTVDGKNGEALKCVWFSYNQSHREKLFQPLSLRLVTDSELNPPKDGPKKPER